MERRVVFKSNIDRTIRAEKRTEQDKGEKHRDAELVRDTVQKHTGKDHNGRQEQERSHRRSPFTTSGKVVFFIVSERERTMMEAVSCVLSFRAKPRNPPCRAIKDARK